MNFRELLSGTSRHYLYEVRVHLFEPVLISGIEKRVLNFGGVVMHRSWFPNPGEPYMFAMRAAVSDTKTFAGVASVHPSQLEMIKFERVK